MVHAETAEEQRPQGFSASGEAALPAKGTVMRKAAIVSASGAAQTSADSAPLRLCANQKMDSARNLRQVRRP